MRWVRISCERIAAQQAERAAEHFALADDDVDRLIDVVRCLHTCLMGTMTAALNGSAGVGALADKQRKKALADLEVDIPFFEERTLTFRELVAALQEPGRLQLSPALTFSEEQLKWLGRLDEYRALSDHPKPTSWSVSEWDVRMAVQTVAAVLPRIKKAGGHWHTANVSTRFDVGISSILAKSENRVEK